jgi:Tol biopolymer transport system component
VALKTDSKALGTAALSFDGRRIAFDCAGGAFCIANVATGATIRVPRTWAGSSSPSWSYDGARLAIQSDWAAVTILDSTGATLQTVWPHFYIRQPRLSADGNSMVFGCDYMDPYGESTDLCIGNVGSSSARLFQTDAAEAAPAPDGIQVAYTVNTRLCITTLARPECGAPRSVCESLISQPAWSPDSKHVVVVHDGSLWLGDVRGENCVRLVQATTPGQAAWGPSWSLGRPRP